MENREKLIVAIILLLAFSTSAYSITQHHLLDMDSYSELLLAKNALGGKLSTARPFLYQLTIFLYQISSSGEKFDAALLLSIAKILPVVFSLVCAVSFYFMLKHMLSDIAAFGGAVLLASSQAFLLRMSSGIYSTGALGMCAFTLACAAFFLFYSKRNYLLLIVSFILFGISAMSWNAAWVMIGGILLSLFIQLVYQCRKRWDAVLAHGVIAVFIVFLLTYFIAPRESIFKEMKAANLEVYLLNLPLIIIGAAAFVARIAGRHKCRGKFEFFITSFFIFSIILSLFEIFPSSLGVALFSAFALNELVGVRDEKLALALFSGMLLFSSFEFSQTFLSLSQAALASLLIAATSIFIASLYREKKIATYIALSAMALSLFSSVGFAALTSSQRRDVIGAGVDEMLEWAGKSLPDDANVWAFRISPLVEFTAGRRSYANDTEFARFMLSNESAGSLRGNNITHVIIDAALFDSMETLKTLANNTKVRIDSFRFFSYGRDSEGNAYAVFASRDGKVAWAQADPSGSLVEGNVVIVTSEGRWVVPLKKFLRLGSSRLIYPQDNYRVNLFTMFFEDVNGLRLVHTSEDEEIKVFEVLE